MGTHAETSTPIHYKIDLLVDGPRTDLAAPAAHQSNGHAPERPRRKVAAVCPCFNRPQDAELLMKDLSRLDLRGIDLWVVLVDNASTVPLSNIKVPPGLRVEHVRSEVNTGGSGGFNLGMAHVLAGKGLTGRLGRPDYIWWLDSDARVARRCLRELVKVLARRSDIGAVGSALSDLYTGQMWELGGEVMKKNGQIRQAARGDVDRRLLVKADYLAACSALVRREAIEATGLFPENFIYFDDVEWSVQMRRKTGLKLRAAPRSVAYHPPAFRRFMTWGRYYVARNCFSHMNVMQLSGVKRFWRAMLEVSPAVAQALMGVTELSRLRLRGLRDAADRRRERIEPKDLLRPLGFRPYKELREAVAAELAACNGDRVWIHPFLFGPIPCLEDLKAQLAHYPGPSKTDRKGWRKRTLMDNFKSDALAAAWRLLTGPSGDVAIVPTGWPSCWFRGRVLVEVTTDGFFIRRVRPWAAAWQGAKVLAEGVWLAARLAARRPATNELPPAPAWAPAAADTSASAACSPS